MIFADDTSYSYTRKKREGFYSYSELFRRNYGFDYECSANGSVVPTTARTVNFKQLCNVLRSTEES